MSLKYVRCNVPVLPLRKDPAHTAEQVSQLLFGEKAILLEEKNDEWSKIRCAWDNYEGWSKSTQLTLITKREYHKSIKYLTTDPAGKVVFQYASLWLPQGSALTGTKVSMAGEEGKFRGKKSKTTAMVADAEALRKAALQYLYAPYQWGGRCISGIDCSGLTQMVYKLCNIPVARDAAQQAEQGEIVDFLQHACCGDLAFFDNKEGKINHTGILLDAQTIIHATDTAGRVVIDRIDGGGIISQLLRKRTHQLRLIKRFLPQPV